jgi:small subunit ribosomal protein S15
MAFGMREWEKKMVFEHLPLLSVDMSTRREMNALHRVNAEEMAAHHAGALAVSVWQVNVMAAIVDLCNVNVVRIEFESCRRVIAAFSELGKLNDTGRTEVQMFKVRICLFFFSLHFNCPFWRGSRSYP